MLAGSPGDDRGDAGSTGRLPGGTAGPLPVDALSLVSWAPVPEARRVPDIRDTDNARFFLWNCSGGYPIGVFSIFARSRIAGRGELEPTHLFFAVGFNPYGIRTLGRIGGPFRAAWQFLHDRVTSNVLNRFKRLCEATARSADG